MTHASALAAPTRSASPRRGQLALFLQETLTAAVRLRPDRPIGADSRAFRGHVTQALATAEQDAARAGYDANDVRAAVAVVAGFVDESIVASKQPFASDWKPLVNEFAPGGTGDGVLAAEMDKAHTREDSDDVADLLEVFALCLALGTRGSGAASGDRAAAVARLTRRVERIRGDGADAAALWSPPPDGALTRVRTGMHPLILGAIGVVVLSLVVYGAFWFMLRSSIE